MAYTYQADVWCNACGEKIKADIARDNPELVPEDPENETTFDSGDYPKYYDAESEESDGPENCADGSCGGQYRHDVPGDAKYLGVGRYGTFLENRLTTEGYKRLVNTLNKHGEHLPSHAREWAEYYQFTWHQQEYESAHDWLNQYIASLDRPESDTGNRRTADAITYLSQIARDLGALLDGDQIQDLYQSDMDADGFFKQTGWYSPEYDAETETADV